MKQTTNRRIHVDSPLRLRARHLRKRCVYWRLTVNNSLRSAARKYGPGARERFIYGASEALGSRSITLIILWLLTVL